jgi:hypothetical protein
MKRFIDAHLPIASIGVGIIVAIVAFVLGASSHQGESHIASPFAATSIQLGSSSPATLLSVRSSSPNGVVSGNAGDTIWDTGTPGFWLCLGGTSWTLSRMQGAVQQDTSTGTQSNFVINSGVSVLRWTNLTGAVSYDGFKCGSSNCSAANDGQILIVYAVNGISGFTITLVNDASSSSTASNQITILNGKALVLSNTSSDSVGGAGAILVYDGTSTRWRVISWVTQRVDPAQEFVSTINADGGIVAGAPAGVDITGGPLVLNNGNNHIRTIGLALTPTSCGSSPTIAGATDIAGHITIGLGGTGCTLTFNAQYTSVTPSCVVTYEGAGTGSYTVTDSTLTIIAAAGTTFDYFCIGVN